MFIQLIAVGRLKGNFAYLNTGIEEYLKRIRAYAKISLIEVPDETVSPSKTTAQIMAREAERLFPYIEKASYTIALSEHGKLYDSQSFSEAFFQRNPFLQGQSFATERVSSGTNTTNGGTGAGSGRPMIILVGGALGLSESIIHRADWVVSLSPMTFPHPLVRLIFLEQLYRAFKIHRKEPYHK